MLGWQMIRLLMMEGDARPPLVPNWAGFVHVCLSARHLSLGLPHHRDIHWRYLVVWQKTYVVGQLGRLELHLIDSWFPWLHQQVDFLARAMKGFDREGGGSFTNRL